MSTKDNKTNSAGINSQSDNLAESRRKAVQKILAGTTIAGAAASGTWVKPVVDSVLIPAHAQTSLLFRLGGGVGGGIVQNKGPSVLDFFVETAIAQDSIFDNGCLEIIISGGTFTGILFSADKSTSRTVSGTVNGTLLVAEGSFNMNGELDSPTNPTSCAGQLSSDGPILNFRVSNNGAGSCFPVIAATTAAPATTCMPSYYEDPMAGCVYAYGMPE